MMWFRVVGLCVSLMEGGVVCREVANENCDAAGVGLSQREKGRLVALGQRSYGKMEL